MAHKGIGYPLAFRRDYNINVQTYRGGLGHAYDAKINMGGVVPHLFPDGTTFRCAELPDAIGNSIFWLSPLRTFAGIKYRVRMVQTITGPANDFLDATASLERDGVGSIVSWRINEIAPRASFTVDQFHQAVLDHNPAYISDTGSISFSQFSEVRYP